MQRQARFSSIDPSLKKKLSIIYRKFPWTPTDNDIIRKMIPGSVDDVPLGNFGKDLLNS